ncbi:MAG: nucleotide exchange factor GrpE [Christensenellaceae bacterium]|jgi:molecular chaperone GrpE|nr:nucleotide exchange factor GrpE [Christensenellaceae bacterium]
MEENKIPEPEIVNWESIAKYKAAELENYIKRTKDATQNAFNDGRAHAAMTILPLGDSLAEALKTVQNPDDKKGIEILARKFDDILRGIGVEEIPVNVGDKFDPYIHQTVTEATDGKNKITAVFAKGYRFAGRTIRPAMVQI